MKKLKIKLMIIIIKIIIIIKKRVPESTWAVCWI